MLAEDGLNGVNVRMLARRSGVTPPTIYSLIGAREDVVLTAMQEAVQAMRVLAERRAQARGANVIIVYCQTVMRSVEMDPDYYRQIDSAATCIPGGGRLVVFFEELMRPMFWDWLNRMKARGDIRPISLDLEVVTDILVHQQISLGLEWARGSIDASEYGRRLVAGAALVLRGLVSSEQAAQIEPLLPRSAADHATPRRPWHACPPQKEFALSGSSVRRR